MACIDLFQQDSHLQLIGCKWSWMIDNHIDEYNQSFDEYLVKRFVEPRESEREFD